MGPYIIKESEVKIMNERPIEHLSDDELSKVSGGNDNLIFDIEHNRINNSIIDMELNTNINRTHLNINNNNIDLSIKTANINPDKIINHCNNMVNGSISNVNSILLNNNVNKNGG